ncbi:MAG TPA: SURF1 family protein [Xanthobacteraceae bacterium]|nr:SURF1 family protein [Xanthobacteraceae bacterium]
MPPVRTGPGSLLWPGLCALGALAILLGLGTWQLQRHAWKNALIATVEARIARPAEPAPAQARWPDVRYDTDEYRRVFVTGRFRHDLETAVYALRDSAPGAPGGPGFVVLTPLETDDGAFVLVNRGFVPNDRRRAETRPEGQAAGTVTVTGLLRLPEQAGLFQPGNDPVREGWYVRDPAEIAAARHLAPVAPFIVDADAKLNPGGLPQGGLTRIDFPNRHLEYAFTWFGLAGTLVGVFAVFAFGRLRRREV